MHETTFAQSPETTAATKRIAIAGLGAVGMAIAERLDKGLPGYRLAAVSARSREAAAERLQGFAATVPVLPIEELEPAADIVVECAPAALFAQIAEPFLRAGKTVIALSVGALLTTRYLEEIAAEHGGKISGPSGALLGLDAVAAAAEGVIHSVRMITAKPVRGLLGAPHLEKSGLDLTTITAPTKIFDGTAREAAIGFPANLNVAVALSLAGVGPDETRLEIWADPDLDFNTHRIEVISDSARLEMKIENIPSDNPKTGRITAQSVIAVLRKINSPLAVGT